MVFDLRLTPADSHVFEVEPETPIRIVPGLDTENLFDEEVFHVGIVIAIRFGETVFNDLNMGDTAYPSQSPAVPLWSALVHVGPGKGFSLLLVPSQSRSVPVWGFTLPAVTLPTVCSSNVMFFPASTILRLTVAILRIPGQKARINRVY
jgi:hypothetical protein